MYVTDTNPVLYILKTKFLDEARNWQRYVKASYSVWYWSLLKGQIWELFCLAEQL